MAVAHGPGPAGARARPPPGARRFWGWPAPSCLGSSPAAVVCLAAQRPRGRARPAQGPARVAARVALRPLRGPGPGCHPRGRPAVGILGRWRRARTLRASQGWPAPGAPRARARPRGARRGGGRAILSGFVAGGRRRLAARGHAGARPRPGRRPRWRRASPSAPPPLCGPGSRAPPPPPQVARLSRRCPLGPPGPQWPAPRAPAARRLAGQAAPGAGAAPPAAQAA